MHTVSSSNGYGCHWQTGAVFLQGCVCQECADAKTGRVSRVGANFPSTLQIQHSFELGPTAMNYLLELINLLRDQDKCPSKS